MDAEGMYHRSRLRPKKTSSKHSHRKAETFKDLDSSFSSLEEEIWGYSPSIYYYDRACPSPGVVFAHGQERLHPEHRAEVPAHLFENVHRSSNSSQSVNDTIPDVILEISEEDLDVCDWKVVSNEDLVLEGELSKETTLGELPRECQQEIRNSVEDILNVNHRILTTHVTVLTTELREPRTPNERRDDKYTS
ncbi:hypothetical protein SK128_003656, partial [Halocaridina rubra]